jgi:DNA-binding NtrC family response regulator
MPGDCAPMPETRRPARSEQRNQLVLILSHDPLAAALLGGLVETLGYAVVFRRSPETAEDSLRRIRPRICLVDCADPTTCREEFLARAAMRGICVVVFGNREALERVRDLATAHKLETLLMPPDLDELEEVLQRAGDG